MIVLKRNPVVPADSDLSVLEPILEELRTRHAQIATGSQTHVKTQSRQPNDREVGTARFTPGLDGNRALLDDCRQRLRSRDSHAFLYL